MEGREVVRPPLVWSFRRPSRSFLWRFFAHLIIRLLVITSLPAPMQAYAVLFPVSMLWPLIEAGEAPGVSVGPKNPTSAPEDPMGNITNFERSQYFNPETGMTAIGAGGGVIAGEGGVELRIPEGALERAVQLKVSLASQTDFPQLPEMGPDAHYGAGLKVESPDIPTFAKPLTLVFPKPEVSGTGPGEYYYTVLRKVAAPNDTTLYEAVAPGGLEETPPAVASLLPPAAGRAGVSSVPCASKPCRAESSPSQAKSWERYLGPQAASAFEPRVISLDSLVFGGWADSVGLLGVGGSAAAPALFGVVAAHAILMWQFYRLLPGTPKPGLITGKVLRVKWGSPGATPQYEGVAGAMVTGSDAGGIALLGNGGMFAVTDKNGTFALEDRLFTGGSVTVTATDDQGVPRSATAFEMTPADTHSLGLGRYNAAKANIIFPTVEPPPPPPQVAVRLFKVVDGLRVEITGGLAVEDTPLLITLKPSNKDLRIGGVEINGSGAGLEAREDLSIPWNPQEEAPTYLVYDNSSTDGLFVPGNVGSYALRIKVMRGIDPVPFYANYTFRAVTAGGVVDNDPINPPRIIDARTLPKDNARGVPVGVTPQLSFTEPVKNVTSNVFLDEVGGGTVPLKLIGIGPQGQVIPVVTDADVVTAITVQPEVGLKFLTKYRLRVRPGNDPPEPTDLLDLDVTALGDPKPKTLAEEYAVGFETFGPEDIQAQSDSKAIAGMAALGDLVYVAETQYRGGISSVYADGWFRKYDLSDPTEPKETALAYLHAPPSDLAIEPTRRLVAISMGSKTAAVAHPDGYTEILSSPSNVYVYDVKEGEPESWVGAVSMTNGLLDGMVQRVSLKGDKVYTATWRKGIQIVDLDTVTGMFKPPTADPVGYGAMMREMSIYGHGWGLENVVTIPVKSPPPPAAPLRDINLWDIQAADVNYQGVVQTLVFATGASADGGLVIANPASNQVVTQMAARTITAGYAVEVTTLASKPIALVAGVGTGGGLLVVFDLSALSQNPPLNPVVLASIVVGGWPTDIVMSGNTAIVAIGGGKAELVDLTTPSNPRVTGELSSGIGTRLALTGSNLLVSTYRTYLAGVNNPLQGLHVAAFDPIAAVGTRATLSKVVEGAPQAEQQEETLEDSPLRLNVFPSTYPVAEASLQLFKNGVALGNPIGVAIGGGRGLYTLAKGFQKKTTDVVTAQMSYQADGKVVQNAPKEIPIGDIKIRVDTNNDTIVAQEDTPDDQKDEAAVGEGKSFGFWEAVPFPEGEDALVDYATLSLRARIVLRPEHRVALRFQDRTWDVRAKALTWQPLQADCPKEKAYLCHSETAKAQLDIINKSGSTFWQDVRRYLPFLRLPEVMPQPIPRPGGIVELPQDLLAPPFRTVITPQGAAARRYTSETPFLFKAGGRTTTQSPPPQEVIEVGWIDDTGRFVRLSEAKVEIKPFPARISVLTARAYGSAPFPVAGPAEVPSVLDGVPASFLVRSELERSPNDNWAALPMQDNRANLKAVNILVHGFAVPDREAETSAFPAWFKRLYWVGHPVLKEQNAHTIGVTWPGDVPAPGAPDRLVYPVDEFLAFQAGLPLGRFLEGFRGTLSSRQRINIFAHSLGNVVVNTALTHLSDASSGVPITYVMNDPAVPVEAFSVGLPAFGAIPPGFLTHAVALGFNTASGAPRDTPWETEWRTIERWRNVAVCPASPPGSLTEWQDCLGTKEWLRAYSALDPALRAERSERAFFLGRWGLIAPEGAAAGERPFGGPWHGFFSSNLRKPGVKLVNTYNSGDHVLRTDQGAGAVSHAWYTAQVAGKPNGGAVAPVWWSGASDDQLGMKWSLLRGTSTTRVIDALSTRLWPGGGHYARELRQLAELALWFPAVSAAAGASPVPGLTNIEMKRIDGVEVGGDGGPGLTGTPSHSYLWVEPFKKVWKGYVRVRNEFASPQN